jgi:hypothetical protein
VRAIAALGRFEGEIAQPKEAIGAMYDQAAMPVRIDRAGTDIVAVTSELRE